MKLIKQLMILLSTSSLLGCSSVPQLDVDLCGINFASDKPAHLRCYNTLTDYADGTLIPGAKPKIILIKNPAQLNAGKFVSKEDWAKVEAWAINLRSYAKDHCQ